MQLSCNLCASMSDTGLILRRQLPSNSILSHVSGVIHSDGFKSNPTSRGHPGNKNIMAIIHRFLPMYDPWQPVQSRYVFLSNVCWIQTPHLKSFDLLKSCYPFHKIFPQTDLYRASLSPFPLKQDYIAHHQHILWVLKRSNAIQLLRCLNNSTHTFNGLL